MSSNTNQGSLKPSAAPPKITGAKRTAEAPPEVVSAAKKPAPNPAPKPAANTISGSLPIGTAKPTAGSPPAPTGTSFNHSTTTSQAPAANVPGQAGSGGAPAGTAATTTADAAPLIIIKPVQVPINADLPFGIKVLLEFLADPSLRMRERIGLAYGLGGGWEEWLQVELTLYLKSKFSNFSLVDREHPIFVDGKRHVDIWCKPLAPVSQAAANHDAQKDVAPFAMELKCSYGTWNLVSSVNLATDRETLPAKQRVPNPDHTVDDAGTWSQAEEAVAPRLADDILYFLDGRRTLKANVAALKPEVLCVGFTNNEQDCLNGAAYKGFSERAKADGDDFKISYVKLGADMKVKADPGPGPFYLVWWQKPARPAAQQPAASVATSTHSSAPPQHTAAAPAPGDQVKSRL